MSVSVLRRKAKQLLAGALKHAGKAALAAALVPLGAVTATAEFHSSRVDATVTPQESTFLYDFTVFNTTNTSGGSPLLIDWELPLFSLADIDALSITSPFGWSYDIVPYHQAPPSIWNYDASTDPTLDPNQGGDPDLYGPNPEVFEQPDLVLHWFAQEGEGEGGFFPEAISPGDSLGNFSFVSDFNSLNAPYVSSWQSDPPQTGDPPIPNNAFGTPLSPARIAAQGIPEPSTVGLLGLGSVLLLVGAGFSRRRHAASETLVVDTQSVGD